MSSNLQLSNESASRIFDYFVVCGLPAKLAAATATATVTATTAEETSRRQSSLTKEEHDSLLYSNLESEANLNFSEQQILDPIIEIQIYNHSANEIIPHGYECIWTTKAGHSANLCPTLFKTNDLFLLIKRGRNKPPISDIGIFYDNGRERILDNCTVLTHSVGGNSANLNMSSTSFNADKIFVTYRRATELACNALTVIDVCVIVASKAERAPHSYNEIKKDLTRGIFGSSVRICYKKAWIPAPQIKYAPSVLYRYPNYDHSYLPFPNEVASFGLPMGASIESWPKSLQKNSYYLKPSFSTFILNVNSNDGVVMEKVYGTSLTFYEAFEEQKLSEHQKQLLPTSTEKEPRDLHSNKCLIILSRSPLFDAHKKFLLFLFEKYSRNHKHIWLNDKVIIPIERFLMFMIYEAPFPTHQKPCVRVDLTENEEDCLMINLPYECVLPQYGASFTELITNLGVENSINVFLFVLLQNSVMVHSLRKQVLTSVVEAISCIIFPFIWRYSYIPMCPLTLCQMIEAPGSFILGMDTRFFDLFNAPDNVICVDLDTNSISSSSERQNLNLKILPRKALNTLKSKLTQLETETKKLNELRYNINNQKNRAEFENKLKRKERHLDLMIREAFLRFMLSILCNYKSFLRTTTRRPDLKALDRNLSKYFDCEGFLKSKDLTCQHFFHELIKTQLFYDCIMNLSFTSELDPVLADSFAFFADICTRFNSQSNNNQDELRLLEYIENTNQTMVILPPVLDENFLSKFSFNAQIPPKLEELNQDFVNTYSSFVYENSIQNQDSATFCFPKTKQELLLLIANSKTSSANDLNSSVSCNQMQNENRQNSIQSAHLLVDLTVNSRGSDTQSIASSSTCNQALLRRANCKLETPVNVRTKTEKLQAQKRMISRLSLKPTKNPKQNEKNKFQVAKIHAFQFLSNAYALWFMCLSSNLKDMNLKRNALNYAYQVLIQMQNHNLNQPDEICFRIMMKLCETFKYPTLAVRTYLHMKKFKIDITPLTYSYYNRALIDPSSWPEFDQDRWAKLRLTWLVANKFRENLKLKKQREEALRKKMKRRSKNSSKTLKRRQHKDKNQTKNIQIENQNLIFNNVDNNYKNILAKNPIMTKGEHQAPSDRSKNNEEMKKILLPKSESFKLSLSNKSVDIYLNTAGIIINSKRENPNINSLNLSLLKNLNISTTRLNHKSKIIRPKVEEEAKFEGKQKSVVEIKENDPLNAFSTNSANKNLLLYNKEPIKDLKRRLFDYEPFSKESNVQNSDFLYEPNKTKQSKREHSSQGESFLDDTDEDEYLDEYYEDSDYDDSEENYESNVESEEENSSNGEQLSLEDSDPIGVDEQHFKSKNNNNNNNNNINLKNVNEINSIQDSMSYYYLNADQGLPFSQPRTIIDIENISISSNLAQNKKADTNLATKQNSSFQSPFSSPFSKLLLNKKIQSFVGSSGTKLKEMTQIITEKSMELKEVLMTNTQQQELASKLKSFSNYQLSTPKYLNSLIKSNSNAFNLSHADSNTINKAKNTPSKSSMTNNTLETNVAYESKLDLENIHTDENFKNLAVEWWDLFNDMKEVSAETMVHVQISSCNYCDNCKSFLYDEEIMSAWTLKESDLNINCVYCSMSLVPKLYIKIRDYETLRQHVLGKDISLDAKPKLINSAVEFTVEYFSPLVVRKELENIILNSLDDAEIQFLKNHQIIFWNLVWYFKRIGVDNGFLITSFLNERIRNLIAQENLAPKKGDEDLYFKFSFFDSTSNCNKPFTQNKHVLIKCLWDNLRLHNEKVSHDLPLYLCWLIQRKNDLNSAKSRQITVYKQVDLEKMRQITTSVNTLGRLCELIIRNVKNNEIKEPFKALVAERVKSKMSLASVYREMLFLVLVMLERELIDLEAFDSEFREVYSFLIETKLKNLMRESDRPPNNIAVWCRRLFSPLLI